MADEEILKARLELDEGDVVSKAGDAGEKSGKAFESRFQPDLNKAIAKAAGREGISPEAMAKRIADASAAANAEFVKADREATIARVKALQEAARTPGGIPGGGVPSGGAARADNFAQQIQPLLSGIEAASMFLRGAPISSTVQMAGQALTGVLGMQAVQQYMAKTAAAAAAQAAATPQFRGGAIGETEEAAIARRLAGGARPPPPPGGPPGGGLGGDLAGGALGGMLSRVPFGRLGIVGGAVGTGAVAFYELEKAVGEMGLTAGGTSLRWQAMARVMGQSVPDFLKMRDHFAGANTDLEAYTRQIYRLAIGAEKEFPAIEKNIRRSTDEQDRAAIQVRKAEDSIADARRHREESIDNVIKAEGELAKVTTFGAEQRQQQADAARLSAQGAQIGLRGAQMGAAAAGVGLRFAPEEAALADIQGKQTVEGAKLSAEGARIAAKEARARFEGEDPRKDEDLQDRKKRHALQVALHNEEQAELHEKQAVLAEEKRQATIDVGAGPEAQARHQAEAATHAEQQAQLQVRQTALMEQLVEHTQRYNTQEMAVAEAARAEAKAKQIAAGAPDVTREAEIGLADALEAQKDVRYKQIPLIQQAMEGAIAGKPVEGFDFRQVSDDMMRATLINMGKTAPEIMKTAGRFLTSETGEKMSEAKQIEVLSTILPASRGLDPLSQQRLLGLVKTMPTQEQTPEQIRANEQLATKIGLDREIDLQNQRKEGIYKEDNIRQDLDAKRITKTFVGTIQDRQKDLSDWLSNATKIGLEQGLGNLKSIGRFLTGTPQLTPLQQPLTPEEMTSARAKAAATAEQKRQDRLLEEQGVSPVLTPTLPTLAPSQLEGLGTGLGAPTPAEQRIRDLQTQGLAPTAPTVAPPTPTPEPVVAPAVDVTPAEASINQGGASVGQALEALSSKLQSWSPPQAQQAPAAPGTTVVQEEQAGGFITGPGHETSDSIPARLSHGEYVIKASSVRKIGVSNLDAMNATGFAEGGVAEIDERKRRKVGDATKDAIAQARKMKSRSEARGFIDSVIVDPHTDQGTRRELIEYQADTSPVGQSIRSLETALDQLGADIKAGPGFAKGGKAQEGEENQKENLDMVQGMAEAISQLAGLIKQFAGAGKSAVPSSSTVTEGAAGGLVQGFAGGGMPYVAPEGMLLDGGSAQGIVNQKNYMKEHGIDPDDYMMRLKLLSGVGLQGGGSVDDEEEEERKRKIAAAHKTIIEDLQRRGAAAATTEQPTTSAQPKGPRKPKIIKAPSVDTSGPGFGTPGVTEQPTTSAQPKGPRKPKIIKAPSVDTSGPGFGTPGVGSAATEPIGAQAQPRSSEPGGWYGGEKSWTYRAPGQQSGGGWYGGERNWYYRPPGTKNEIKVVDNPYFGLKDMDVPRPLSMPPVSRTTIAPTPAGIDKPQPPGSKIKIIENPYYKGELGVIEPPVPTSVPMPQPRPGEAGPRADAGPPRPASVMQTPVPSTQQILDDLKTIIPDEPRPPPATIEQLRDKLLEPSPSEQILKDMDKMYGPRADITADDDEEETAAKGGLIGKLVRGFANGGMVGEFTGAASASGFSGRASVPTVGGGQNTLGFHQLDLRTNVGNFQAGVSQGTMEAIGRSALNSKLSQTGPRPTWYS